MNTHKERFQNAIFSHLDLIIWPNLAKLINLDERLRDIDSFSFVQLMRERHGVRHFLVRNHVK